MHGRRLARIGVVVEDAGVCVRCVGEVDLMVVERLREAVDVALGIDTTCWIDLTAVTFIDASGIHELLDAQERAVARGGCVLIAPTRDPGVMRPFELLGLLERLPFAFDPPGAARFAVEEPAGELHHLQPADHPTR